MAYITGTNKDDIIPGPTFPSNNGHDVINALAGNDIVNGGLGNDKIDGGGGNDTLTDLSGHNTLLGGNGNDTLATESGNDTLDGGNDDDELDAGEGNNTLSGGNGNDSLKAGNGDDSLYGGNGNDTLLVGNGKNKLDGGNGNDVLTSGTGDDYLSGGNDDDTLDAGGGNNTLHGGNGNDTLLAGNGKNKLDGGNGNDVLTSGTGDDYLSGGNDDDTLDAGGGNNTLYGGNGNDTLLAGNGNNKLDGGNGNDVLTSGTGDDYLSGGNDDDTLDAGGGNNTLHGGNGNDTLLAGNGNNKLDGGNGNDVLTSGTGDDYLSGGNDDDTLDAGGGNNTLYGGNGNDTLTSGDGQDSLNGGLGDDTLIGNSGADDFKGDDGNDVIIIGDLAFRGVAGGKGTDTLALAGAGLTLDLTDPTLAAKIEGIERIDLTGSGNNSLTVDQLAVFNETRASGNGVHILTVEGNSGDAVTFTEAQWAKIGTFSDACGSFDRYVFGLAEVRVEQGLTVNFPSLIDLTTLSAAQGFIIQGDMALDFAGDSVSAAGDVNGDGFADLIVGANGDDGGDRAGEAYVVFGKASGFGTTVNTGGFDREVIDLTTLSAADGFIIQGDTALDFAGISVSEAGDVNGDGFADLIVGAANGDDGGLAAGEAYVVFGKASGFGTTVNTGGFDRQVIDLTTLSAADGFIIQGDTALDFAGWSVSEAGDVDGDGFADLIVGAGQGDDGGDDAGEAYVVFGKASGFGDTVNTGGIDRQVIDLTTLSAAEGFIIQGDAEDDLAGRSVSGAGDVNGDGFGDLIVAAAYGDDGGGDYAGEAYVVFGKASGFGATVNTGGFDRQVIDLTTLSAADGFIIQGDTEGDNAGRSVSAAGDVNGDGFADLIVGAAQGDDGGDYAGEAYVVFGKASGFGDTVNTGGFNRQVIDLTTLSAADGFIIQGDTAYDHAGLGVSAAGDVNGDGFADLIVGAPDSDDGGNSAGEAYVVFGKASGFGTTVNTGGFDRQVIDLTTLSAADGFIVQGDMALDFAGDSVSAAGDVNGDGFDDLIVGALGGDDGGDHAGEAYVLFGGAFGASAAPVTTTGSAAAEIFIGGLGGDTLTGGGGADVFHSGAGDDVITVADFLFGLADGGTGNDTLVLLGSGASFDFTAFADNKTQSIEAIAFSGSGDNTLTLGLTDVLNMPDGRNFDFSGLATVPQSMVIDGDAGDSVNLEGDARGTWTLIVSDVNLDGTAGGAYDFWIFDAGAQDFAALAIKSAVTMSVV